MVLVLASLKSGGGGGVGGGALNIADPRHWTMAPTAPPAPPVATPMSQGMKRVPFKEGTYTE